MNKKVAIALIVSGALIIGITLWQGNKIIRIAKKSLGIMEIGDNMGWDDPEFESKLRAVGWTPGSQWCVYFVKATWADAYPKLKTQTINGKKVLDYITGNSQTTYSNFLALQKTTKLFLVSSLPKPGDIVVWQYYDDSGKATTKGHVGIVRSVKGDNFNTIEGNTSELGKTEETVAKKSHSLGEYSRTKGLRLKGFIRNNNL